MLTATFIEPIPDKRHSFPLLRAKYEKLVSTTENERREERRRVARRISDLKAKLRARTLQKLAESHATLLLENTLALESLKQQVREEAEDECLLLCQKIIQRLTESDPEFKIARLMTEIEEALSVLPLHSIEEIRTPQQTSEATERAVTRLGRTIRVVVDPQAVAIEIVTTQGVVRLTPELTLQQIFSQLRASLMEER